MGSEESPAQTKLLKADYCRSKQKDKNEGALMIMCSTMCSLGARLESLRSVRLREEAARSEQQQGGMPSPAGRRRRAHDGAGQKTLRRKKDKKQAHSVMLLYRGCVHGRGAAAGADGPVRELAEALRAEMRRPPRRRRPRSSPGTATTTTVVWR